MDSAPGISSTLALVRMVPVLSVKADGSPHHVDPFEELPGSGLSNRV